MKIGTQMLLILTICCSGLSYAQNKTNGPGSLKVTTEAGIDQLNQQYIRQNKEDGTLPGYRVQIYNGKKAETLKKRSEFLSVFPNTAVYTVYEAPEYKVQVGDFRTRLEAEKFLRQVQSQYGSGFLVNTRIKQPPLK